jgi:hypothetical protein
LHRLVRETATAVDSRDGEIERHQLLIKKLQRAQFGRRSERWMPINWRSRLKTSTATLPASGRAAR